MLPVRKPFRSLPKLVTHLSTKPLSWPTPASTYLSDSISFVQKDIFELVDDLWSGKASVNEHHPVTQSSTLVTLSASSAFVPSFANVSVFDSGDGLVMVDTGSQFLAKNVFDQVRAWRSDRLDTAIYSHGHVDHVFGVPLYEQEASDKGWNGPRVISHEALPLRFERYILTAGYNAIINRRQFGFANLEWPLEYRYPDKTYSHELEFQVGDLDVALYHAKGETDDHTWTWIPSLKTICCGDLFIWASPNAGNPQKVQRYPKQWALALRKMIALEPEVLLPGHGFPVVGAQRIRQALVDTADLLDFIVDETISMMNEGIALNDILHSVVPPQELMEKPYLQPVYDEPEFIIRNVWRQYGGWYDGDPANLKPAKRVELAQEISRLTGGAGKLADRALELCQIGNYRLACHLIEWAALSAPDDEAIHRARRTIFAERANLETSTMSKGLFNWAASESQRILESKTDLDNTKGASQ